MRVIWKYIVDVSDMATINMPKGAKALSVHAQGGSICLWAMVDPDAPTEPRRFFVLATGEPFGSEEFGGYYVGTVLLKGGQFVFHVFDVDRSPAARVVAAL